MGTPIPDEEHGYPCPDCTPVHTTAADALMEGDEGFCYACRGGGTGVVVWSHRKKRHYPVPCPDCQIIREPWPGDATPRLYLTPAPPEPSEEGEDRTLASERLDREMDRLIKGVSESLNVIEPMRRAFSQFMRYKMSRKRGHLRTGKANPWCWCDDCENIRGPNLHGKGEVERLAEETRRLYAKLKALGHKDPDGRTDEALAPFQKVNP